MEHRFPARRPRAPRPGDRWQQNRQLQHPNGRSRLRRQYPLPHQSQGHRLQWPQRHKSGYDQAREGQFDLCDGTGQRPDVYLDGIARTSPFTVDTLIDFNHTVEARNQTVGNNVYTFASWSDGGTQTHSLVAPSAAQSYTASFTVAPAAPTGLMLAWGFNEGAGTSAADSSGNNNTATLLNGLTWGTGSTGLP